MPHRKSALLFCCHCQRNVLKLYNNPYILPWKRSVHLTFNEPSFHVTYGLGCDNVDNKPDPKDETCDRNFQFDCTSWKCVIPTTKKPLAPIPTQSAISEECKELNIGADTCRQCTSTEVSSIIASAGPTCPNLLNSFTSTSELKDICPCILTIDKSLLNYCSLRSGIKPLKALYKECENLPTYILDPNQPNWVGQV